MKIINTVYRYFVDGGNFALPELLKDSGWYPLLVNIYNALLLFLFLLAFGSRVKMYTSNHIVNIHMYNSLE